MKKKHINNYYTKEKYYHAGWLIDGSGNPIIKNAIFSVKLGKINKVFKLREKLPFKKKIIDLSKCTVLPCFIDAHVHLIYSGSNNVLIRKQQLKSSYKTKINLISNNLRQQLSYGVIGVRDAGEPNFEILKFKNFFLYSTKYYSIINSPGPSFYNEGSYGKFIGGSFSEKKMIYNSLKKELSNRNHIKIINSGLIQSKNELYKELPQFRNYELTNIINVANLHNKRTMIHSNSIKPVKSSIISKCHSIEHGFFMGKFNIKLMAYNSITWVPTLFTMKAYIKHLKKNKKNSVLIKKADLAFKYQLTQLNIAKKYKLKIAVGTDSGSPGVKHGFSIINELNLLIKAGYSVEESISCATKNSAELINKKNVGQISKNMEANFIVLKSKPKEIPKSLRKIDKIFIRGKELSI